MSNKIGFWSVFALVTGSQIGTGVFILPASLAPFGFYSLAGWIISGCGAIALSLVFASLCSKFPQTGGPHVYVKKAFGPSAAFFTGWTYWVISWISSTAVVITAISYLAPVISSSSYDLYLILEILLLFTITGLNLLGLKAAGKVEVILTLLKFVPLLLISVAALYFFNKSHFILDVKMSTMTNSQLLGQVTLLTLWGFIGLESATTAAGNVENPSVIIPKAIILGTLSVVLVYLLSSLAIMGIIPGPELALSKAPYVEAAQRIFGGNWHILISLIASIVCIGTLNAWMIASGQIALGLAEDKLMPDFFARKNQNNAPYGGIIVSCFGILPLLILTSNETISEQITSIIDFSVTAFLFVYLICSISFIKLLWGSQSNFKMFQYIFGFISIGFCLWVIYETALQTVLIASFFVISGVPVYIFWYRKSKKMN